jgi:hypothetical protein
MKNVAKVSSYSSTCSIASELTLPPTIRAFQLGMELTVEERNLLSVAYKNVSAHAGFMRPFEGSSDSLLQTRLYQYF